MEDCYCKIIDLATIHWRGPVIQLRVVEQLLVSPRQRAGYGPWAVSKDQTPGNDNYGKAAHSFVALEFDKVATAEFLPLRSQLAPHS